MDFLPLLQINDSMLKDGKYQWERGKSWEKVRDYKSFDLERSNRLSWKFLPVVLLIGMFFIDPFYLEKCTVCEMHRALSRLPIAQLIFWPWYLTSKLVCCCSTRGSHSETNAMISPMWGEIDISTNSFTAWKIHSLNNHDLQSIYLFIV